MNEIQRLRVEANYRNLDRVNGWIANAEAKAGAVFAASGVLMGLASFRVTEELRPLMKGGAVLQIVAALAFAGYILTFLASLVQGALVFFPRLKAEGVSPFYFGSIARLSLTEFEATMQGLTPEKIEAELIRQTHINAVIAEQKFVRVQKALRFFIGSLVLGCVFLVLKGL